MERDDGSFELIAIGPDGDPERSLPSAPPQVSEVKQMLAQLYRTAGFAPPWIGYFAVEGGSCVGTCSFKGPPGGGAVEIAYFTFPGHEGRGVATRMARQMIRLAERADPLVIVEAQTLPEESASTSILRKLGFAYVGPVHHPEDGVVWQWRRPAAEPR